MTHQQLVRQGHPFKELDLNPAAVYTKKPHTQRHLLFEVETALSNELQVRHVTSHSDLMALSFVGLSQKNTFQPHTGLWFWIPEFHQSWSQTCRIVTFLAYVSPKSVATLMGSYGKC